MKIKTLEQVERMKDKAVRFVRDVLGDEGRAEEIDDESPEAYADRKRIEIIDNPHHRSRTVPNPTKDDLEQRIEELENENDELRNKLDAIGEVLDGDEEEGDEEAEDQEEEYDER